MTRFPRRRRRPIQNGIDAIFSGKARYRAEPDNLVHDFSRSVSGPKQRRTGIPVLRVLSALFLIGIGFTLIGGAFFVELRSPSVIGRAGPGPTPPVRDASWVTPQFLSLTNIAETVLERDGSYRGTLAARAGDFLVLQIAYSEGGSGNLPDLLHVNDTLSSVFTRAGSASPGVGSNFWEQVWTGRARSSGSTNMTVTPDWSGCAASCVGSIIISMTVVRYGNVGSVGTSTVIAPNASSTSQTAGVAVDRSGSVLVELLSHGAYNNCESDVATPRNGQTFRNCFTGTTERTELFDRTIPQAQSYDESYVWSQLEVQRGIYLELDGSAGS